jgi:hypothetical protein
MKGMTPPQLQKAMQQNGQLPKRIVLFAGIQDTLLNRVHRERGNNNNNNRDLCLRQDQIVCHLHLHFVQSAIEGDTGLISATQNIPLMTSSLTPHRKNSPQGN